MCGIAGAVYWQDPADADPVAVVSAMVEALDHRGPDGHRVAICQTGGFDGQPRVVFGHARLSILDLSERGAQPMQSERGPNWITFNGEIYNFDAIRHELEARGRSFRSRSDTEVLLQGYEEWGQAVVDRLRGMFAFGLWDGTRNRLWLARDRMGIKPLYVYRDRGVLLFASEIRALLRSGLVPRRLDVNALEQYLRYQSVAPPQTLLRDVTLLPPGHMLEVGGTPDQVTKRAYWDLLDAAAVHAAERDELAARARVRNLLAESTALHLVSDVPVGIFLSGGIDSSALVAMTRKAGVLPRTFAIALPGSSHDEARFARRVAERFDAEHIEIALSERDFRTQVPEALDSIDHPSGDGLNTFVVSRAVRATGIKVALSGLGGDEIFGGYPSFRRLQRLATFTPAWRRSPAVVRWAAAAAVRAIGRESVSSDKAATVLEGDATVPQAFPVLRQLFSDKERERLLGHAPMGADPYVELLEDAVERHPDASVMSLVSYGESRTYMHDVLLRDTDQMSMAHALEVRVPFLDHELAAYVTGLPDAMKSGGDVPKRLLVEALDDVLPADCVRRPKQGFVLPFDTWMKGELRALCEHHLGPDGLEGRGILDASAVQSLWRQFLAGDRRTSWSRPWTLVALNAWLERNEIVA